MIIAGYCYDTSIQMLHVKGLHKARDEDKDSSGAKEMSIGFKAQEVNAASH